MVSSLDTSVIASHRRQALIKAWEGFSSTSCPDQFNFHLHSICSDGSLHPLEVLDQARSLGLQGFTLTDHHTVEGYETILAHLVAGDPHVWVGMEITADLIGTEVHILGFDFNPAHSALEPYLQGMAVPRATATDVIKAIHQANGLAVLAHPFRYTRTGEELIKAAVQRGMDGIEAYYAYRNNPSPWKPTLDRTQIAEALAHQHRLYKTGGTDTHGLDITRRI
ncbi:MAG: PHP domain-containing protein [Synechococcaceae cyanobacterium SM2_3_2]|nr:PHP domain-containing protein [Synechococcaceae cyanobacterium SM2_3_2]